VLGRLVVAAEIRPGRLSDLVRTAEAQAGDRQTPPAPSLADGVAGGRARGRGRLRRLLVFGRSLLREHKRRLSRRRQRGDRAQGRATLAAAQAHTDVLKTQRQQADAAIAAKTAALAQAKINLAQTTLSAPIDGVVGDRTVRPGQLVQPGTRLMTVVPTQSVYLIANFKETQTGHMTPGQPVSISVDSFPGQTIVGTVDSLAPGTGAQFALLPPENATGNFTKIVQRVPVKILLDPKNPLTSRLRPGLSVTATVDTHDRPQLAVNQALR